MEGGTPWVDHKVTAEERQAQNQLAAAYKGEIDNGIASQ
jgi:hypothetical protein